MFEIVQLVDADERQLIHLSLWLDCTRFHSLTTPPASLRTFDLPSGVSLGDCFILYVGDQDSPSLANLMMENAATPIYAYSPTPNGGGERAVLASARTSSMLSRRLFAVHRAMAASTFGILVHNVGLARSRTVVRALRELLQSHGKKSYTVSVGRLNPAKLANFEVVECWVLVGCREAGLVDPKEYYRPIVTPWELQLALQGDAGEWAPERWTLDFEQVIRGEKRAIRKSSLRSRADSWSLLIGLAQKRKSFHLTPPPPTRIAMPTHPSSPLHRVNIILLETLPSRTRWMMMDDNRGAVTMVKHSLSRISKVRSQEGKVWITLQVGPRDWRWLNALQKG